MKRSPIFRYCRQFISLISFSLFLNCLEPVGPKLEPVTDIYIGGVLQTGRGIQKIYVCQGTDNPQIFTPSDSTLLLKDAEVFLSGAGWRIQLFPDRPRSSQYYYGPYFSTGQQQILIEPEKTYSLEVNWQGQHFVAQTTTPVAPKFNPIDTTMIIDVNSRGYGYFELSWESPAWENIVEVSYPAYGGINGGFNIFRGHESKMYFNRGDSTGIITAVVALWNEDYEKAQLSTEELSNLETPMKLYSNIPGAHGVFAAMSNDTLKFHYRTRKILQ